MKNGNGRAPRGAADGPHTVRVLSVKAGTSKVVRILSPTYGGLFVHWLPKCRRYPKGKSTLCRGVDCPTAAHRLGRIWRGYAAVQVHVAADKLWAPAVLELSAHAELDVRERWARGQVWRFERPASTNVDHGPVGATLLGSYPPHLLPEPFDVLAVLAHVFPDEGLTLGHVNPLGPRVTVPCDPFSQEGYTTVRVDMADGGPESTASAEDWRQRRNGSIPPSGKPESGSDRG